MRSFILLVACYASTNALLQAEDTRIRFRHSDTAALADFVHTDGSSGQHYLVEAVASGLASFDYNLDGKVDLYFLNGAALKGTEYADAPVNGLFRNLGSFEFDDRSILAGLADRGFGLGVAVGDLDSDGFPDVYINNFGANALFFNNGDGTFRRLHDPIVACGNKIGAGVCMLDIENDGDLDIYVANYIQFDYDMRKPSVFHGRLAYGGPVLYPTESDDLLRNNGDGTFTNISDQAGITSVAEWGMGTLALDADEDGDTDIFVANDSTVNFLWENDGTGHFTEVGLLAGFAFDHSGETQGSMGIDVADVDGDGLLDILQTSYEKQMIALYGCFAAGLYEDRTLSTGALTSTTHLVNWGVGFGDFDNDADPDAYVANGHIHDNLDEFNDRSQYRMRDIVYENNGKGVFRDVSTLAGLDRAPLHSSRGVIVDDLNFDGRLDVVVLNSRNSPTLLENSSQAGNHWLQVDLVAVQGNRDAVGAKLELTAGGQRTVKVKTSGRGYQSHFGSTLHFGLGNRPTVDSLRIIWPDGSTQDIKNISGDTRVVVRQGVPGAMTIGQQAAQGVNRQ